MKNVIIVALVVVAAGCASPEVSGVTCSKNSDCASGQCNGNICVPVSSGSTGTTSSGSTSSSTSGSTGSSSSSSGSTGSSSSSGSSGTTGAQCPNGCPSGEYCASTTGGSGQCAGAYTVSFLTPTDGGWYDGGGATVVVNVAVVTDSHFGQPSHVTVGQCDGGATDLTYDGGGNWAGLWTPVATMGDYTTGLCATASWDDAGVVGNANVLVNVDVTPPTVNPALSRQPTDMSDPDSGYEPAFARDEDSVTVIPNADDPGGSGVATVTFGLRQEDGGAATGIDPVSGVFTLQTPFIAEHGMFIPTVTAVDRVGNSATIDGQPVKITRWKWVADTGVPANLFTPAVGSNGLIYLTNDQAVGSNVFAFNASDGSGAWAPVKVGGAPVAGPALNPSDQTSLFVLEDKEMTILKASDGGGPVVSQQLSSIASQFSIGAVGSNPSTGEVAFVAAVPLAATSTAVFGFSPAGGTPFIQPEASADTPIGTMAVANNVWWAVDSSSSATGIFHETPLSSLGFGAGATLPNTGVSLGSGPSGTLTAAFMAGGVGSASLIRIAPDGGSLVVWPPPKAMPDSIEGDILIPREGQALAGIHQRDIELASLGQSDFTVDAGPSGVHGDVGMLLSGGSLYAESGSKVTAVDMAQGNATRFGAVVWQIDLSSMGSSGVATAAPSLVCGAHGRSVLLVPTKGQLVALVIDDYGLNTSAPWPKSRRDFGNTANAALTPSQCP